MANCLYPAGKEAILKGDIDFEDDTLKCILLQGYTYSSAHDYLDDITNYRLDTDVELFDPSAGTGNPTVTNGVFDAYDVTWSSVASGSTASHVVIYKDSGVASSSPLLVFLDTITNFPVTTNGGDITVQWDSGAYKIFSL